MVKITVDKEKCTGCGTCVQVCPVSIFELNSGKSKTKKDKIKDCLECKACEVSCPASAIKVE
ncbi:MAG: 4Fe-4S binding protein [archaeon]|nr:4Fe-4S binding protein [Candidatus Micrarchaeota archaeon]